MTVTGNILIELDVHHAVIGERVHPPRFGLAWLQEPQRLGNGNLIDQDLLLLERGLGDPVARLYDRCLGRAGGGADSGGLGEELADRHGVGSVVGALIDDLEHVIGSENRRRDLHASGAPAIGHRHLPAGERNLISRDRDGLENCPADHPLGLLVEIGEVVDWRAHSAASRKTLSTSPSAAANSARISRTRPSSAWKST